VKLAYCPELLLLLVELVGQTVTVRLRLVQLLAKTVVFVPGSVRVLFHPAEMLFELALLLLEVLHRVGVVQLQLLRLLFL